MPVITYFEDDDGDKWTVAEDRLLFNDHAIADVREFAEWLQSELAKADPVAAKPDADGWIEWHGGECPVDGERLVDVTFRDGDVLPRRKACDWRWRHEGFPGDIIRYRLSKGGEA